MNKKLLLITLCIFTLSGLRAQNQRTSDEPRKLALALYAISNFYVDNTDEKKLVEDAIVGMLEKLDPHSDYSNPEETKELTEPLESNFDGIGIQFNMLTDTLYIIQIISGGPSEKVGLMAGDRMIFVDDTLIAGVKMKNTDVMKRLRGPKGTEVRVKVKRGNRKELLEFKIIRGKIPIYSLDAAYMADKTTGYIRLNRFAVSSIQEFREAMDKLRKQGMTHLVLDLQGNGGGYLHVANELADEFLNGGKLIVYTHGNKQPRENAFATEKGGFETGRLVIMVDEYSASASEIVSGAIQDWDRGIILGRRTFGKGLVQKPIPLPDGSMIRLTVARYYTPSGRNIQKPYTNGNDKAYNRDLIERYNRGELMSADSIHFPDSLMFETLVSKRTVYGGGGIMPDVFIPFDSTRYTDYHRSIVGTWIINRVSMSYLDRNRKELNKKYPAFDLYNKKFEVPEDVLQELLKLAGDEKIEFNEEQYAKSRPLITLQIKALIARNLFDMNEYFQIINDDNASLKEALRIINDSASYNRFLGQP
jgi:carboxyl-terminal processing protease